MVTKGLNMRHLRLFSMVLFLALFVLISQQIFAQECTDQLTQAMSNFAEVCTNLGSESACAASDAVTFEDEGISEIGTVAALADVSRVATTSIAVDDYGIAMLNVNGNVPLVLSDTGIRYLLLGDAALENQVDAANAYQPQEAVQVVAVVGANLRTSPSTEGRVVGGVTPGEELAAYALSADQQWLLVLHEADSKWVSRQVVNVQGEGDLDSLPVWQSDARSLMQSFNLTTNSAMPDCVGVPPSLLLLQGPEGFNSLVTVNGADIRFTSTIIALVTPDQQLQLIVLNGSASSNALSVPAGFTMFAPLDVNGQVSTGWTGLRPISGNERALLTILQGISSDALYTAITIPTEADVALTLASLNGGSSGQMVLGPASSRATCQTLRPTSPLQGMGNRTDQAFYWDGASGATSYSVNIFNESGSQVGTAVINSNTTTALLNTTPGGIGDGGSFSWEVQALVDGEVACTSGRVTVLRDAFPVNVNNPSGGGGRGGGGGATPTPCPWTGC
jgi:hypothetical protein